MVKQAKKLGCTKERVRQRVEDIRDALQTDKKELENNDFLNTATLVILDAKMKYGNELKELTSFDIFDQNKINEVKNNPNGAKYPMAVFTFYENCIIISLFNLLFNTLCFKKISMLVHRTLIHIF